MLAYRSNGLTICLFLVFCVRGLWILIKIPHAFVEKHPAPKRKKSLWEFQYFLWFERIFRTSTKTVFSPIAFSHPHIMRLDRAPRPPAEESWTGPMHPPKSSVGVVYPLSLRPCHFPQLDVHYDTNWHKVRLPRKRKENTRSAKCTKTSSRIFFLFEPFLIMRILCMLLRQLSFKYITVLS